MALERSSGLLLHISSLPSYGGIGDFGPAAYAFADFLAAAKQRLWQVLPLSPTGYGNSPYAALSAFAGNPLLISLEKLVEAGWLAGDRIAGLPGHAGNVHFEEVEQRKWPLLVEAAHNFLSHHDDQQWARFQRFREENAFWLAGLRSLQCIAAQIPLRRLAILAEGVCPPRSRRADSDCSRRAGTISKSSRRSNSPLMSSGKRCAPTARSATSASSATWPSSSTSTAPTCGPTRKFSSCDEDLTPIRVAGVPPDYFSATGQRWGNPIYKWDVLESRGFDWWVDRMRRTHALYDIIRLDHFRGFEAFWAIPAEDETAIHGEWVKAPGAALFTRAARQVGRAAADRRGSRPDHPRSGCAARAVRSAGHAGAAIWLQRPGAHNYLPHRYVTNTVVYTGTHDNDTTLGWWQHGVTEEERHAVYCLSEPGAQ